MILRGDKRPQPNTPPRLMVVGGGTGGHVFPGVAVGQAWLERVVGGEVVFVGSPKGMEARVIPGLGHPFVAVEARRLKNAGLKERLRSLISMPLAIWRGFKVVRAQDPTAVLGVGGYISGPVVLAAALAGRPCAIAEQNARPGLTNRILGKFVQRVFTAFPEAADGFPQKKVRMLGNPVRADFIAAVDGAPLPGGSRNVLILGGSQGARALNQKLPPALLQLKQRMPDLVVRHQTGRDKDLPVREAYGDAPDVTVEPFIDDMVQAMLWADLIIARAGATTVAELACIGRPAVFVPFPAAADDHQTANAKSLADHGAAILAPEHTLTTEGLIEQIGGLLEDTATLTAMAEKAKLRGRPEAGAAIVDALCDLAPGSPERAPAAAAAERQVA